MNKNQKVNICRYVLDISVNKYFKSVIKTVKQFLKKQVKVSKNNIREKITSEA